MVDSISDKLNQFISEIFIQAKQIDGIAMGTTY
jgi:hypothetical protein